MSEPDWMKKMRKEGRIKETTVNEARLASDSTSRSVALPADEAELLSEKQFQARVMGLALGNGWLVYHTHDSRRSEAGFPDLVMVRGKRIVFAELKKESGTVSPEQDEWLKKISATSNETYVWRPSLWPEIVKVLTCQE